MPEVLLNLIGPSIRKHVTRTSVPKGARISFAKRCDQAGLALDCNGQQSRDASGFWASDAICFVVNGFPGRRLDVEDVEGATLFLLAIKAIHTVELPVRECD
jgi:hypothetical protein